MTFVIPPDFDRHLDRTKRSIESLIQRHVITSFGSSELKTWLKNFSSDSDLYLASHLMDFLVIRSSKMLVSMCHNAVEHTIMGVMRELSLWKEGEYALTLNRIKSGDTTLPFRFVVIEGFGKVPAKSGAEVARFYTRSGSIHKSLLIQPKRINEQASHIKVLIMLDDFSGTGSQFCKFSKESELHKFSARFQFVFTPLMAHKIASQLINKDAPFVKFRPVETLSEKHNFFGESTLCSGAWIRDEFNLVEDVKNHYFNLLNSKGVNTTSSEYDLGLAVGFDISTPNNTLNVFWTTQGSWKPLLKRP